MKFFIPIFFAAFSLSAQTNNFMATNAVDQVETNQPFLTTQRLEEIRAECLQGRRLVCGKILKVFPDGLVVESGYTNLLRSPLDKFWLLPPAITASRAPNLVEGKEPGCIAVGLVFLTNLPKSRGAKPKQYGYVVIEGYPTGQHTYTSVGDLKRTVRRFATDLPQAVQIIADEELNKKTAGSAAQK